MPPRRAHRRLLSDGLSYLHLGRLSGVYIFLAFVALFAIWIPGIFLTAATWQSIVGDQAITGIAALAVMFPLVAGVFDLSVAQNLGLSAVVSGALMTWSHLNPVLAVLITLAMGAGIGVINGVLVAWIGVNSFITTLGMTSALLAITEGIANGNYVGPFPPGFSSIGTGQPLGIPIVTIYLVVLAVIVWYVLEHTPIGRRAHATGANPEAARLAGVRTRLHVFWSYVVCGVGAALAGVLLSAKLGSVSQEIGPPYLLPAYTACFLGATQLRPGRFNVGGTILALYLLATGVKGLQLVGGQLWVTDLFNGVGLVIAVTVGVLAAKGRVRAEVEHRDEG